MDKPLNEKKKKRENIQYLEREKNPRPVIGSRTVAEKIEMIRANRWCVGVKVPHADLLHCFGGTTATRFCVDFFVILLAISLEHRHSFCGRLIDFVLLYFFFLD